MAVQQQDYFEAIGRAGLTFADGVIKNINKEKSGCQSNWNELFCWFKKIEVAEYFFRIGDYAVSDNSAIYYSHMLDIAGSSYSNATIDPNAQLPGVNIIIQGVGAEPVIYNYTESDLLLDNTTNTWYLEYKTADTTPFNITSDTGTHVYPISSFLENDDSWAFPRIYGFPPNTTTQLITIYTI